MSRDDSVLYSGANSTTRRKEEQQRRLEEKRDAKRRLEPEAKDIFAEIEKLREKNYQRLITLVSPDTPDDNVHAILLGVRFNEEDLKTLKNTLKTVLRAPDPKPEPTNE